MLPFTWKNSPLAQLTWKCFSPMVQTNRKTSIVKAHVISFAVCHRTGHLLMHESGRGRICISHSKLVQLRSSCVLQSNINYTLTSQNNLDFNAHTRLHLPICKCDQRGSKAVSRSIHRTSRAEKTFRYSRHPRSARNVTLRLTKKNIQAIAVKQ